MKKDANDNKAKNAVSFSEDEDTTDNNNDNNGYSQDVNEDVISPRSMKKNRAKANEPVVSQAESAYAQAVAAMNSGGVMNKLRLLIEQDEELEKRNGPTHSRQTGKSEGDYKLQREERSRMHADEDVKETEKKRTQGAGVPETEDEEGKRQQGTNIVRSQNRVSAAERTKRSVEMLRKQKFKEDGVAKIDQWIMQRREKLIMTEKDKDLARKNVFMSIVAFVQLVLVIINLNYYFNPDSMTYDYGNSGHDGFDSIQFLLTLLLLYMIYDYYWLLCNIDMLVFQQDAQAGVFHSRHKYDFMMELFVCAFHSLPGAGVRKLSLLMFPRIYLFMRLFRDYSSIYKWRYSSMADERMNGVTLVFDSWLSFRAAFYKHSWFVVACLAAVVSMLLAYAIFICERESHIDPNKPTMKYFLNAYYFTVVTMTTVGYGDIIPLTRLGVFISIFSAVCGLCLVALQSTALLNTILLNKPQRVCVDYVNLNILTHKEQNLAARVLQHVIVDAYKSGKMKAMKKVFDKEEAKRQASQYKFKGVADAAISLRNAGKKKKQAAAAAAAANSGGKDGDEEGAKTDEVQNVKGEPTTLQELAEMDENPRPACGVVTAEIEFDQRIDAFKRNRMTGAGVVDSEKTESDVMFVSLEKQQRKLDKLLESVELRHHLVVKNTEKLVSDVIECSEQFVQLALQKRKKDKNNADLQAGLKIEKPVPMNTACLLLLGKASVNDEINHEREKEAEEIRVEAERLALLEKGLKKTQAEQEELRKRKNRKASVI